MKTRGSRESRESTTTTDRLTCFAISGFNWIKTASSPDSDAVSTASAPSLSPKLSFEAMNSILARTVFEGGYKIESVTDADNAPIEHTIVKTMMRLDLDQPLAPNASTEINIRYSFNIVDAKVMRARGGYEFFEKDENHIYEIAQWYPRVVAYTDYQGWQHKQFLGRGEFTLELGDYTVRITVPNDMVVAATGELQNPDEVLKPQWAERLAEAKQSKTPKFVITPEEAKENESERSKQTKTWIYDAKNVRDFAFAASRKFIWDAMGVDVDGDRVWQCHTTPTKPSRCGASIRPSRSLTRWRSMDATRFPIPIRSRLA